MQPDLSPSPPRAQASVGSTAGGLLVLGLLLLSFYLVRRLVLPRLEALRSFCYRSSRVPEENPPFSELEPTLI